MANRRLVHTLLWGALCAGSTFMLNSCMDDSYDLDKVDLTMGLGSDGLGLTLIKSAQEVKLESILDTDESVKTDANNLYYFVEDGNSSFDVTIDKVTTTISNPKVEMDKPVIDYDLVYDDLKATHPGISNGTPLPISAGYTLEGDADGNSNIDFDIADVKDVVYVNSINFGENTVALTLTEQNSAALRNAMHIKELKNITVTLPKFMKVKRNTLMSGWEYDEARNVLTCAQKTYTSSTICSFKFENVELKKNVVNESIVLNNSETTIKMDGKVTFGNTSGREVTMGTHDYASAELKVVINNSYGSNTTLTARTVKGRFNPTIDPDDTEIDIKNSLPDFLTDEEVNIKTSDPTIRFDADFRNIPVGVNFSALLSSVYENGNAGKEAKLPKQMMDANNPNVVYYYDGNAPYDPEGVAANSKLQQTTEENGKIGQLIEKLPDNINVMVSNNRVTVDSENEYTVELGKSYNATVNYNVYVPFKFNKDFVIVYKDTTNSFNSDIKDYAADGIKITLDANNTIPLDLQVSIVAQDVDGNDLPNISFKAPDGSDVFIPAEVETKNIIIVANLENPNDLKKIDRVVFKVHAKNNQEGGKELCSTQGFTLTNVRLRLMGQIVGDFN